MTMRLSKSLMKSLQKAYGQYLNASQPRTYNSIYSNSSNYTMPRPSNQTPTSNQTPKPDSKPGDTTGLKPLPYKYRAPNFLNNTIVQSNPNLELQEFQQAQKQLLQNQRMQQLYATTRNAGQMKRQMPAITPPQPIQPTQPPRTRPYNPPSTTTNYGLSNPALTSTPKSSTSGQTSMTKPSTSIEDTNPAPSTGASILGTTTKRYAGIRKSAKATASKPASTNSYTYSTQYMHEGTGKVPNIPSTNRSIPRNQKYF